ncbi:MAG: TIGR04282 family arsenosugar biosynthesis glycosyltransferase [Gemmatimonadota bacterium]|jgi:rSAM/selenodomain-associated transferase 1|nr:TIGR04282 family arsenosugar biosynthesis glycosyltransferase [Gemmatimonadota bacterium]
MSTALIIFAKAPVPGHSKTRLIPALGPEGAARLAGRMLDHTIREMLQLPDMHLELCVSPTAEHPAFESIRSTAGDRLNITLQGDGDLGERMHRALTRVLSKHTRAILIGTDAPGLNSGMISRAEQALESHSAVFVPARDGGYALVGLTRPAPELFLEMTWSTSQVMRITRARAHDSRLLWAELPAVNDIDQPADLVYLPDGWR